jgi:Spy/CpxP family protein refolding chaperone
MNKNRYAIPAAVAAGLIVLCAMPAFARAQSAPPAVMKTPSVASPVAQPNSDALPADDFSGLNYTEEQKAEIRKIHMQTESRKGVVAKDQSLSADQKNAMLVGYTRMEYGQIYKVLSPEQQKQVRRRIVARRAADQAEKKKQPPSGN